MRTGAHLDLGHEVVGLVILECPDVILMHSMLQNGDIVVKCGSEVFNSNVKVFLDSKTELLKKLFFNFFKRHMPK